MTICKKCNQDMGYFEKTVKGKLKKIPRWKCQKCSFEKEITIDYGIKNKKIRHLKYISKVQKKTRDNICLLNILRECECDNPKKVFHHPDYQKPFEVMLLCQSCHIKEHQKVDPTFNTIKINCFKGGRYKFYRARAEALGIFQEWK